MSSLAPSAPRLCVPYDVISICTVIRSLLPSGPSRFKVALPRRPWALEIYIYVYIDSPATASVFFKPTPTTLLTAPRSMPPQRCDLGSLADALDNGMFRKAILAAANAPASNASSPGAQSSTARSPGGGVMSSSLALSAPNGGGGGGGGSGSGSGGAAMRAIYLTLLEVALALRHLHAMNLVHCDVRRSERGPRDVRVATPLPR